MNNRLDWLDTLKGTLMVLVLWGHFFPPENVGIWIYSFHMPAFFIISGYLRKERSFSDTVKTKFKGLLIPYIVTAIASFILGVFIYKGMGMNVSLKEMLLNLFYLNGSVGWNSPIWFLIVLFELEVFFSLIKKLRYQAISMILLFCVGYFIYKGNIVLPFGLHVFVWASIFYYFGLLMKKNRFELNVKKHMVYLLVSITMLMNIFLNKIQGEITAMYHSQLGIYIIFFVNGIVVSYVIIAIYKYFEINIAFFKVISKYSLFIMCTHYFLYIFYRVLDKFLLNNYLLSYSLLPSILNTIFCILSYIVLYKIANQFKNKNN